jgi:hypothetical protein
VFPANPAGGRRTGNTARKKETKKRRRTGLKGLLYRTVVTVRLEFKERSVFVLLYQALRLKVHAAYDSRNSVLRQARSTLHITSPDTIHLSD